MIWPVGQSIRFVVCCRFVYDDELEPGQVQGPTGLSSGKFLFRREINKIPMIRPNFDGVLPSFKVVSERLKSSYNCEEL